MTHVMLAPSRETLSVAEAAKLAGVSKQSVYGWIARGHVASAGGDARRVDAAEVRAFMARRQAAAAAGIDVRTLLRWLDEPRNR